MLVFAIAQAILFLILARVLLSYVRYHREYMPMLSTLGFDRINDGVILVVPAKDEEAGIGPCLEHLVQLKGLNNFKIVAVNDRSTDQTEARMREVAAKFPDKIEVVGIRELPAGWLGKNHACWTGAQHGIAAMPGAKYLLFTDGDVKFHPDTVAESVTWMERKKIDFMTLIEDSEYEGVLEPAYLLFFGILIIFFSARPWLLHKKNGRNFMGNGAYLLSRRDAYEATQGHKALRLEVVEDLRMGLLMRAAGYHCGTAVGLNRIRRRWQPGFTGIFRGLLKNAFAGVDYNIGLTLFCMLFLPFVFIGPWLCLFTGYPGVGALGLGMIGLCFIFGSHNSRIPWFTSFLLSPFMSLVASANLATSTWITLKNGGVKWRNTVYPIKELKAHCLTVRRAFASR